MVSIRRSSRSYSLTEPPADTHSRVQPQEQVTSQWSLISGTATVAAEAEPWPAKLYESHQAAKVEDLLRSRPRSPLLEIHAGRAGMVKSYLDHLPRDRVRAHSHHAPRAAHRRSLVDKDAQERDPYPSHSRVLHAASHGSCPTAMRVNPVPLYHLAEDPSDLPDERVEGLGRRLVLHDRLVDARLDVRDHPELETGLVAVRPFSSNSTPSSSIAARTLAAARCSRRGMA
jgi:hypothetical protein